MRKAVTSHRTAPKMGLAPIRTIGACPIFGGNQTLADQFVGPGLIVGRQRGLARHVVVDPLAVAAGLVSLFQGRTDVQWYVGVVSRQRHPDARQRLTYRSRVDLEARPPGSRPVDRNQVVVLEAAGHSHFRDGQHVRPETQQVDLHQMGRAATGPPAAWLRSVPPLPGVFVRGAHQFNHRDDLHAGFAVQDFDVGLANLQVRHFDQDRFVQNGNVRYGQSAALSARSRTHTSGQSDAARGPRRKPARRRMPHSEVE